MTALPNWVQGARRPSMLITWYEEDSTTPEALTGATITGFIRYGVTTIAITGVLTVIDGAAGQFRWDFSAADVANAGALKVQFVATFGSNPTPAKTFQAEWHIKHVLALT